MKIAVFSDSHDNMEHIKQAIAQVKEMGITHGFHLGDYCAPPSILLLAESGIQWTCVWGNVDGDKLLSLKRVEQFSNMDFTYGDGERPDSAREVEVEGRKIFLTHYPQIARMAALSGQYDAAFFGHNHQKSQEVIGKTLLANPGELAGFRFGTPTFAVYDTENNSFEIIEVTKA